MEKGQSRPQAKEKRWGLELPGALATVLGM